MGTDALCQEDGSLALAELDLSENPIGAIGSKEIARAIASDNCKLRIMRLRDCFIDLASFWRLVGNLSDGRPLSQLDLRCNPIGRGTRRCWRCTMGPTIRCEVLLSDHPLKARKEALRNNEELNQSGYLMPR